MIVRQSYGDFSREQEEWTGLHYPKIFDDFPIKTRKTQFQPKIV
jgi:hypothetical protein